ncbi:MAG: carboxypeptidase-like regulatory domain-containing protein [Candidatus Sulfotelmatobacter sp.]
MEEVGSDFSLKVSFRGAPILGNKIELRNSGGDVVATSKTDSRGVVHFHAVPAGSYVADSTDGLLFPSTNLEVKAKYPSIEEEAVEWPEHAIVVRSPRGRFSVSEEGGGSPAVPLRGSTVELRDLYSGRVLESKSTDVNGDFEFAANGQGVYAVRLALPKKGEAGFDNRSLALVLDPAASEESIPEIKAVQSECNGIQLFTRSRADDQWVEF